MIIDIGEFILWWILGSLMLLILLGAFSMRRR